MSNKNKSEAKTEGVIGVGSMRLLGDWSDISTAPSDGTRFIGRKTVVGQYTGKLGYIKRITWHGKVSHVPLYGWCYGRVEDVNSWEPTHWKPITAKSPNADFCERGK